MRYQQIIVKEIRIKNINLINFSKLTYFFNRNTKYLKSRQFIIFLFIEIRLGLLLSFDTILQRYVNTGKQLLDYASKIFRPIEQSEKYSQRQSENIITQNDRSQTQSNMMSDTYQANENKQNTEVEVKQEEDSYSDLSLDGIHIPIDQILIESDDETEKNPKPVLQDASLKDINQNTADINNHNQSKQNTKDPTLASTVKFQAQRKLPIQSNQQMNQIPLFTYPGQTPAQLSKKEKTLDNQSCHSSISDVSESFKKRAKFSLTQQEIESLQKDLRMPNLNKKHIQKKYGISQSTVNRYFRKMKDRQAIMKGPNGLSKPGQKNLSNTSRGSNQHSTNQNQSSTCFPPDYQPFNSRKRNSKVRLIEAKLVELYRLHPQMYQSQASIMLSKHFQQDISIHVVSRCLRNLASRKKNFIVTNTDQHKQLNNFYQSLEENTSVNIQYRFQFAREFLSKEEKRNIVYVDETVYTKSVSGNNRGKPEKVHFALAVSGGGKIVHWKLKSHSFKPQQISKFIQEIAVKLPGYTILLDNVKLHRQPQVRQIIKTKSIKHLYLPPCSPQLNPILDIFPCCVEQFKKKLTDDLDSNQTLRLAHFTIMQIKQKPFAKQVASARYFIDIAFRREPFPFNKGPKQIL